MKKIESGRFKHWMRKLKDETGKARIVSQAAIGLCDHLIESRCITEFKIDMGGGGNWDDEAIFKMCERLGFSLQIDQISSENELLSMMFSEANFP